MRNLIPVEGESGLPNGSFFQARVGHHAEARRLSRRVAAFL